MATQLVNNTEVRPSVMLFDDEESSESEPTKDSITMTHSLTVTMTNVADIAAASEILSGNPKNWKWDIVQKWLISKGLKDMIPIFVTGSTDKGGTDGEELLGITLPTLINDSGPYNACKTLNISHDQAETNPLVAKFLRELTKLQLKANEEISASFKRREATVDDVLEMKRRINLFVEKWDRILWIGNYVDTTHGILPSADTISEELGISLNVALVYLHYYATRERMQKNDVDELLLDFNVYDDCVIWWFVLVLVLTNTQTEAIWLIFNRVAELTPGNMAIELLDRYKNELTRYPEKRLEEMAQNVMIGSQYPICAGLRLSKWFMDIAKYDVAREKCFEAISESFIDAAFDYLDLIKSDHMATIVLEVRSDIEGMNAIEMGLEFQLKKFVTNQRIERITTSIMNDFEFLRPVNKKEAFEIDPLSVQLVWRKMFYPQFYFTPLGTYVSEVFLYFTYLALFTFLSVQHIRVYDTMALSETIFWIFNVGYVLNEVQSIWTTGLKQYYSDAQNYFDTVISAIFVTSIVIRIYALASGPPCSDEPETEADCWHKGKLNTVFVVLWASASITLWLRIINFCTLSHSLGPMVAMIFRMMGDIATFFTIMLILFVAFAMCLMFTLGDVLPEQFGSPTSAAATLFLALLGEFDFDYLGTADISNGIFYFAYGVQLLWLVIGSLVLLNLLIAMMAKTFDTVEEDATWAIIYSRYQLALDRDTLPCFMPPPLNVPVMVLMVIFYAIEGLVNLLKRLVHCCSRPNDGNYAADDGREQLDDGAFIPFDFALVLMPKFMKARKLELDEQILYKHCGRYFAITTNKSLTKCKFTRYKPEIGVHYVKFCSDTDDADARTEKGLKVSVMNSVERKLQWQVDLLELHREGLIDLSQFDDVPVDARFTHVAHQSMSKADGSDHKKSPYWICGYCRGYVKESKISLSRLGYDLNVIDMEMKIVKKVSPEICPNCYRVRLERKRWELVWEILSLRVYYYVIAPCLFILIGMVELLTDPDPEGVARDFEKLKAKMFSSDTTEIEEEHAQQDTGDDKLNGYVSAHYQDTQLITALNDMDIRKIGFFDARIKDDLWNMLTTAKDDIDMFLLQEKINSHVMSLSFEDELTMHEFFDKYINSSALRRNGGDFLWDFYFKALATTIFKHTQRVRDEFVPVPIFGRYPFDWQLLLDDVTEYFSSHETFNKQLQDLSVQEIIDVVAILKPLRCATASQRRKLIEAVTQQPDAVWESDHDDNGAFQKFSRYMREEQRLFQDPRTIKNMERDVSTAIVERGAAASVFLDQIHFLFEDIRNVELATPFFNTMRTETLKSGEKKVELWRIRNTLFCLYYLSSVVREIVLQKNPKVYVTKQQILDLVYKQFEHEIIDPQGITDLIVTEAAPTMSVQKSKSGHDDDNDGDGDREQIQQKHVATLSLQDDDSIQSFMTDDEFDDIDDAASVAETVEVRPTQKYSSIYPHPKVYVTKQQILDLVYKQFEHEIIDPQGITDLIVTEAAAAPSMSVQQSKTSKSGRDDDDDQQKHVTMLPLQDDDDDDSIQSDDDVKFDDIDDVKHVTSVAESVEVRPTHKVQQYLSAQKSVLRIADHSEAQDDLNEEKTAELKQIAQERMALFHNGAITASAVKEEISAIFDNIRKSRKLKLTESTIDYYRRVGLQNVRLLQDDEALRFVFEQLSRYATFYASKMKEKCTFALLREILCDTLDFGEYEIDEAMIPKVVRAGKNYPYEYVQQLYDHLVDIYHDTMKNEFASIIIEKTLQHMSLEDVLSIIMLYERVFDTVNTKIVEDGNMFVVTHAVFCKFADPKGFDPDAEREAWTHKTKAASDFFQAVLHEQQNFITLGQVRQTIDEMMNDISAMRCGELTRIMNYLQARCREDNLRCKRDRVKYLDFMQQTKAGDDFRQMLTMHDDDDGGDGGSKLNVTIPKSAAAAGKQAKQMRNPGLAFKHISKNKWLTFIDKIADQFQMNVRSKTVSMQIHQQDEAAAAAAELEEEKSYDDDTQLSTKKIIESILENTSFDIQRVATDTKPQDNKEEEAKNEKKRVRVEKIDKKRAAVFDSVLSFCSGRITLQQLFSFSKQFMKYLRDTKEINILMQKYQKILGNKNTKQAELKAMKAQRIPLTFAKFKADFFPVQSSSALVNARGANTGESHVYQALQQHARPTLHTDTSEPWDAEIHWLFDGCENEYDLCQKIHPFWSTSIIKDLYDFMESTKQIQGDYELKLAEFGQLKHSLNVNDELAVKLFHIIRFKVRTLTWAQIYDYFKFLLKMKYNVKAAILGSDQAQDTTVSMDGMKLALEIELNDESKALFNKVDAIHGSKVTWKQIGKYLKKVISVRADMRDFFLHNDRTRQFDDERAEIIHSIHDNAETHQQKVEEEQENVSRQLEELKASIADIKRSLTVLRPVQSVDPRQMKTARMGGLSKARSDGAQLRTRLNVPSGFERDEQQAFNISLSFADADADSVNEERVDNIFVE
eukprot:CAMPEP_0202731060 /NCGR_PEP_ID=MMETSP1385-20130828/186951_1 /ASSEMBLY_ACC=CAM_ASM_000861 /TAXON_ID=933848 /ORGANISM="Elphidium margaritaceum" /LENGTH=2462 /DNA_ID=CAMNT_0049397343 /DNA_START=90 /DNA_END=7479 /DNA_ORIENTATION=-